MYDLIRQEEGAGENMFFSPTSMTTALSMAYAGAGGDTASEMAAAMHYTVAPEDLFRAFNWLDQTLESRDDSAYARALSDAEMGGEDAEMPSRDDFRLHIVNSMWGERTMTFEQPFLDTLAVNYGAGVFLADFKGNPDVERVRINDWVAEETLDRIQDLIPEGAIDSLTRDVAGQRDSSQASVGRSLRYERRLELRDGGRDDGICAGHRAAEDLAVRRGWGPASGAHSAAGVRSRTAHCSSRGRSARHLRSGAHG